MAGTAQAEDRQYLCIDLKSFYASVECVERGLDPLATDLVVADPERTEKTICLAVSPSLKAKGVRNRCRVFQIPKGLDYIMAPPRMKLYIRYSAEVYGVYLKYIAKEDIHVYSIDEAFMDVTDYLGLYQCTARELGERIRADVLATTGIPATCGMGTNLYLAKIALDITAKHSPDFFGCLDEDLYKETLWNHRPITDFWRIGPGIARRLETLGIQTMGQVALYPHPDKLFSLLGKDAEILIDHAWGYEPVTIADIKAYEPKDHSIGSAQILACAYGKEDACLVMKEMLDALSLQLVEKKVAAEGIMLAFSFERDSYPDAMRRVALGFKTNSLRILTSEALRAFDEMVPDDAKVRRVGVTALEVSAQECGQLGLFDHGESESGERSRQLVINDIKRKFGKNSLLKGMDLLPNATQVERNRTLGGHRSGD